MSVIEARPPVANADAAVATFRRDGVAVLDAVIDPALLSACSEQIARDYPDRRLAGEGAFGLDVDARRFSMALSIGGALAQPALLANPMVLDVAHALLGDDVVMHSFGLLLSLPGAPDQRTHYDALLFPESDIDRVLPVSAIAVAVPLVRLDETSGTTAFQRGSHRNPKPDLAPDFAPTVPVGSVLLWDYRILHRGLANRGERPRPVLFSALTRSWWQEAKAADTPQYEKLAVTRGAHGAMPDGMQRMLRRAAIVD